MGTRRRGAGQETAGRSAGWSPHRGEVWARTKAAAVVLAAATAWACADRGGPDPASGPAIGGTAVVAGATDLGGLNPLTAIEATTQEFLREALFVTLLRMGEDMTPQAGLAERWDLEGDTAVTFHLRDDVRWHDGHPTTAEDVAFTFRAIKNPETAFPDPVRFAAWDSVEVVDDRTVRFRVRPAPDLLFGWTLTPVAPAHVLGDVAPAEMAQAAFGQQPVGNGPFRFVSRAPNDRVVLEANPDFPEGLGGRPYLDRLVYRVIPESTARVAELVSGGIDLAFAFPIGDLAQIVNGMYAVETDARQMSFIAWNARRPPLDDARVRHALTLAINRNEMVTLLRDGHGSPALAPVPPSHWAFHADLDAVPYDVARARAHLAEAGLRDTDGDGVLERVDGTPFRLELKFPGQDPNFRALSEMLVADLAEVGVDLVPAGLEGNTLIADITSPERRFDAVMLSLEIDMRPNLRDYFHSAGSDGPFFLSGYSDSRLDAVVDSLATTLDRDAEGDLWREAQEILVRDQPWTFLYYFPNLAGVRDRLQGVEMDVRGRLVSVADWWVRDAGAAGETESSAPAEEAPEEAVPTPAG